jgi:hypothetical protein
LYTNYIQTPLLLATHTHTHTHTTHTLTHSLTLTHARTHTHKMYTNIVDVLGHFLGILMHPCTRALTFYLRYIENFRHKDVEEKIVKEA